MTRWKSKHKIGNISASNDAPHDVYFDVVIDENLAECTKVLRPGTHDKVFCFCSTNLHTCIVLVDVIMRNLLKFLTRNFEREQGNRRWLFVTDFLRENLPLTILTGYFTGNLFCSCA